MIWSLRTTLRSTVRIDLTESLNQVVGERIVIINQEDHVSTIRDVRSPEKKHDQGHPSFWIVTCNRSNRKRSRFESRTVGRNR